MRKEDVRILWNETDGKIDDIRVVEFKADKPETWPLRLYDRYDKDTGNCEDSWKDKTITDVLYYFGFTCQFDCVETRTNFLQDITSVEGFEYESEQFM